MLCKCGGDTAVKDSRPMENGNIWRQRVCASCATVTTTVEMICVTEIQDRTLPEGRARPRGLAANVPRPSVKVKKVPPPTEPVIKVQKRPYSPALKKYVKQKVAPTTAPVVIKTPARSRIEDLRGQRELDGLDYYK